MRGNLQRLRDIAITEHYDVMFGLLDDPALMHHFRRDLSGRIKTAIERFQANFDPLLLEDIGEAAFRQTPMQRHLPAFETGFRRVSRARLLTFMTAAGSFAETRALAS